jgi:hypothetical protein
LVSVYDGDTVGLGRVVVDSTWHHWFSYNLVGIVERDIPAYQKMQAYYRNVALWLARPSLRQSMLAAGTWGVLAGSGVLNFGRNENPLRMGELILARLGLTTSPSMLGEFAVSLLHPRKATETGLPEDLVSRAMVGGIASALFDHALDYRLKRHHGQRPRLDADAIREGVIKGASRGRRLLSESLDEAARALGAVRDVVAESEAQPTEVRIPIDVRRLRVVAETLQFPDPGDPALSGGAVTMTIRVRVDNFIAADRVFECLRLPAFDTGGSVIALASDLADVEVQTGETLSIEVLAGCEGAKAGSYAARLRFFDTLRGDASQWVGKCARPALSQPWRLWYRIEVV